MPKDLSIDIRTELGINTTWIYKVVSVDLLSSDATRR